MWGFKRNWHNKQGSLCMYALGHLTNPERIATHLSEETSIKHIMLCKLGQLVRHTG